MTNTEAPIAPQGEAIDAVETAPVEATEATPDAPEAPDGEKKPEKVKEPFPKEAREAIKRRERQMRKMEAEYQQKLREYEERLKSVESSSPKSRQPREEDFTTFAEFREAVARWETRQEYEQKIAQEKQTAEQRKLYETEAQWIQQQTQKVDALADDFIQKNPEAEAVFAENIAVVEDFPPHIRKAFLEADNAPAAFYALAVEGKLDSLADMSPARAAMEIAKAELRAESLLKPKVTNAPSPMKSSRGGASTRNPYTMSPEELDKWFNS